MSQTNVTIRMDEDLKRRFDEFCDGIGLSMSAAITVFIKASLRKKKIPFDLEYDPMYSDEHVEFIKGLISDMDAGKYKAHELIEVDDD